MLVHLVDISSSTGRDPVEDFEIIRLELALFRENSEEDANSGPLGNKSQIIAANKTDALDQPERLERLKRHVSPLGLSVHAISAATGEGVSGLLEAIWTAFRSAETNGGAQVTALV